MEEGVAEEVEVETDVMAFLEVDAVVEAHLVLFWVFWGGGR